MSVLYRFSVRVSMRVWGFIRGLGEFRMFTSSLQLKGKGLLEGSKPGLSCYTGVWGSIWFIMLRCRRASRQGLALRAWSSGAWWHNGSRGAEILGCACWHGGSKHGGFTQRAQYSLNKEYTLSYRGLNIMI